MSEEYLIPACEAEAEIAVQKSRFIASITHAFSVDEAREYIKSIQHRYTDATHHVPVFLIGHGASVIAHCSDNGEPSGTAGRPVLAVLQGSDLGDIVAVVTRYYGGIQLGTGGLVRAYSLAIKETLLILPLARKITTQEISLVMDYHWFEQVKLLLEKFEAKIIDSQFSERVNLEVRIIESIYPDLIQAISSLSHNSIQVDKIRPSEATIFPI